MTFERGLSVAGDDKLNLSSSIPSMTEYANSVVSHLTNILESHEHSSVLSSAK
jgi:hypothetical protein